MRSNIMKKVIFKLYPNESFYYIENDFLTNHEELYNVYLALNPLEDSWIYVNMFPEKNIVNIYSCDLYKQPADFDNLDLNDEEKQLLLDNYIAYCDKRWKEMPRVTLSIQDWQELQIKWSAIKKDKPMYVIFLLDNSGSLDTINIIGKDSLSEEDLAYIQEEHEQYLQYQRAYQKYRDNHVDYSEVWRGSHDDEYEVDVMQYYDKN